MISSNRGYSDGAHDFRAEIQSAIDDFALPNLLIMFILQSDYSRVY